MSATGGFQFYVVRSSHNSGLLIWTLIHPAKNINMNISNFSQTTNAMKHLTYSYEKNWLKWLIAKVKIVLYFMMLLKQHANCAMECNGRRHLFLKLCFNGSYFGEKPTSDRLLGSSSPCNNPQTGCVCMSACKYMHANTELPQCCCSCHLHKSQYEVL